MSRHYVITGLLFLALTGAVIVNKVYAADIVITVTLSDSTGKAVDIADAFVRFHGWIPSNPLNRNQYLKKTLEDIIRKDAKAYRVNKKAQEEGAKEAAVVEVDTVFK